MEQTGNYFQNLGQVTTLSLQQAWYNLLLFLPKIIGALLILIIGWIIAAIIGSVIKRIVRALGVDRFAHESEINKRFGVSAKYHLFSGLIGELVKWFIIIAVLIAAANTLDLPQITEFLNQVALFIPRVIVAVVILVIGVIAGEFVEEIIKGGLKASQLPVPRKNLLGSVAKYAILVFAIMAALNQIGVASDLIQILFAGVMLAFALAFGLGGREEASRFLASIRQPEKQ